MKIKNKLLIGFGLLFAVVMFFGVVSIYYIEEISESSKVTLKNNYETLTFTRDMRSVLDENDLPLSAKATGLFDKSLKKQENNITEKGEKEATAAVRKDFTLLSDPAQSQSQRLATEKNIRLLLKTIDGFNMRAIVQKSAYIRSTVEKTTLYLEGMGFITFLILFVFIVNFPGFILKPLNRFTEGVSEVSRKNYDVRLEFKTNDEFAELAHEFNKMAANFGTWENTANSKIFSEEVRIKTLIEEMPDVVIGINERQEVLFLNEPARKILNLGKRSIIGESVTGLMKINKMLQQIIENKDPDERLKVYRDGKTSHFRQKNIEIVVPNLKPNPFDTVQFSGYTAGIIYILRNAPEFVNSEE